MLQGIHLPVSCPSYAENCALVRAMIGDENINDVVKDRGDGEGGRGGKAMISKQRIEGDVGPTMPRSNNCYQ
jgi:hypothetical protein